MGVDSNLLITPFDVSEADELARWISSERWPFHVNENPTMDETRRRISGGAFSGEESKTFWVSLRGQGDRLAIVCLQDLTDITPVFDLRVRASVRNQGIGRKVVTWLAEYVFTQTEKHRLEGHTRADNHAMQHVFDACGWVREAYYRKAWPGDASVAYYDALAYALLKSDWEAGTTTEIKWGKA